MANFSSFDKRAHVSFYFGVYKDRGGHNKSGFGVLQLVQSTLDITMILVSRERIAMSRIIVVSKTMAKAS